MDESIPLGDTRWNFEILYIVLHVKYKTHVFRILLIELACCYVHISKKKKMRTLTEFALIF